VSSTGVLGFPNPVNEKAARVVAGGVALLAVITLLTGWDVLLIVMALGFLTRVLTGPKLSILGQIATRAIAPRLGDPAWVPGPPKRFAQAIGLTLSTVAAVASLVFGLRMLGAVLIALILVFALMESVIGFCSGCWLFAQLMHLGIVPASTCAACIDVERRYSSEPPEVGPLSTPVSAWQSKSTSQPD
jgi:small-conductance mechanosensitive channel